MDQSTVENQIQSGQKLEQVPLMEDGSTDFLHMWNSMEYAGAVEEELESGSDVVSEQEKAKMADGYEPFTVLNVGESQTQYGARWKIEIRRDDGTDATLMMGHHEQRNAAIRMIRDRIQATQCPVKNIVLQEAFVSQGNAFYVLRPWVTSR